MRRGSLPIAEPGDKSPWNRCQAQPLVATYPPRHPLALGNRLRESSNRQPSDHRGNGGRWYGPSHEQSAPIFRAPLRDSHKREPPGFSRCGATAIAPKWH